MEIVSLTVGVMDQQELVKNDDHGDNYFFLNIKMTTFRANPSC